MITFQCLFSFLSSNISLSIHSFISLRNITPRVPKKMLHARCIPNLRYAPRFLNLDVPLLFVRRMFVVYRFTSCFSSPLINHLASPSLFLLFLRLLFFFSYLSSSYSPFTNIYIFKFYQFHTYFSFSTVFGLVLPSFFFLFVVPCSPQIFIYLYSSFSSTTCSCPFNLNSFCPPFLSSFHLADKHQPYFALPE